MPLVDVPLVECVCWDRDRFGKDYMGEFDIAVEDIFANGQLHQEVCLAHTLFSYGPIANGHVAKMVQAEVPS
jgi:hypothetical protein